MQPIYKSRPKVVLSQFQLDKINSLPPEKRADAEANAYRIICGKQDEAYERKRLERSGLWDWEAKKKEKLVITRIIKPQPAKP